MSFNEIELLQKEITELKGQLEIQQHEIKQLKKSQQDLYLDLDRRLSQVQTLKKSKTEKSKTDIADSIKDKPLSLQEEALPKKSIEPKSEKIIESKPIEVKKNAANETLLYQSAYTMVKTKRYEEAVVEFQKYLSQFPKGEHVANAHYWLGEMYLLQWQNDHAQTALLDKASTEFSTIASQFPNHTKTADAHLKLGLVALDKGNVDAAKQHFLETKTLFPDTSAAKIAENRLSQLP